MPKKYASFRDKNFDPNKVVEYTHLPFTRTFKGGIKADCDKFGRITIIQNHENDEFEQVVVPASVIYKLAFQLDETRETRIVEREELKKELE